MNSHLVSRACNLFIGIPAIVIASHLPHANAAVPAAPIAFNDIRGVKWTPVDEAKEGNLSFDTAGLEPNQFLDLLHAQGINSIVMKVVDIDNQIPDSLGSDDQKRDKRDREIKKALLMLKEHPKEWHVFLWKREWLQRSGIDLNHKEFERDMGRIINTAKAGRYDTIIEGIMPIEINLEDSASVLKHAVQMSHGVNLATDGWLRRKSFLFPGAGMGAYFRGIDKAWDKVKFSDGPRKEADFFASMAKQVGRFSFVVKNMPSQPSKTCALDRFSSEFSEGGKEKKKGWDHYNESRKAGFATTAEAEAARRLFLLETMGARDLFAFVGGKSSSVYKNVIYWGDANEGMTANTRSQWFHQTWHGLLVKEQSLTGHFTYYPVLNEKGTAFSSFELRKFLFQVKTVEGKKVLVPRESAWANWQAWPKPDCVIVPTTSSN